MSADVVPTAYPANAPANYLNDYFTMRKKTQIDGVVVWEKVHNACKVTFSHQYPNASLDAKHAMKCRHATHDEKLIIHKVCKSKPVQEAWNEYLTKLPQDSLDEFNSFEEDVVAKPSRLDK